MEEPETPDRPGPDRYLPQDETTPAGFPPSADDGSVGASSVGDSSVGDSSMGDGPVADGSTPGGSVAYGSTPGETPATTRFTDDSVAAAAATLESIGQRPLAEHPGAFEQVHADLQRALSGIDDA